MADEFVVRDFSVFAQGAGEGQVEVGIVVAPQSGRAPERPRGTPVRRRDGRDVAARRSRMSG